MRHYRRNADEALRALERAAAAGDHEAAAEWTRRMIGLGRLDQIPVGYLRYLEGGDHSSLLDLFRQSPALARAGLTHWLRHAGDKAFESHRAWTGSDQDHTRAFGPRTGYPHRQYMIVFALWARLWCSLLFLQDMADGGVEPEAYGAHGAAMLAGGRVNAFDHETLASLPGDNELDAMIVAMYG